MPLVLLARTTAVQTRTYTTKLQANIPPPFFSCSQSGSRTPNKNRKHARRRHHRRRLHSSIPTVKQQNICIQATIHTSTNNSSSKEQQQTAPARPSNRTDEKYYFPQPYNKHEGMFVIQTNTNYLYLLQNQTAAVCVAVGLTQKYMNSNIAQTLLLLLLLLIIIIIIMFIARVKLWILVRLD